MKKSLVLSSLAVVLLGTSTAFAARPMTAVGLKGGPDIRRNTPPAPPQKLRAEKRIPANAPEDIKSAYAEMFSLRKDLRLELCKDKPDAAMAMEMVKKVEELHAKLREWEVKQILEGNAPKPRPGFGPAKKPGPKPGDGRPGPGPRPGHPVPPPHFGCHCGPQWHWGPNCGWGPHGGPRPWHMKKAPKPAPETQDVPTPIPETTGVPDPEPKTVDSAASEAVHIPAPKGDPIVTLEKPGAQN